MPLLPSDRSSYLARPGPADQAVNGAGHDVISLIDGEAGGKEVDLVEQFARALGVSAPEAKNLGYDLKGRGLSPST